MDYKKDYALGYAYMSELEIPYDCEDPFEFLNGYYHLREDSIAERFDKGKSIPCGDGWISPNKKCYKDATRKRSSKLKKAIKRGTKAAAITGGAFAGLGALNVGGIMLASKYKKSTDSNKYRKATQDELNRIREMGDTVSAQHKKNMEDLSKENIRRKADEYLKNTKEKFITDPEEFKLRVNDPDYEWKF